MKIGGFTLTRDSWIWFWGKLVGFAGLVTTGVIDPKHFGLNDAQQHLVMSTCALILTVSAQFSTSALPGKADAPKDKA